MRHGRAPRATTGAFLLKSIHASKNATQRGLGDLPGQDEPDGQCGIL
jgi:hypothetical protein